MLRGTSFETIDSNLEVRKDFKEDFISSALPVIFNSSADLLTGYYCEIMSISPTPFFSPLSLETLPPYPLPSTKPLTSLTIPQSLISCITFSLSFGSVYNSSTSTYLKPSRGASVAENCFTRI
jgi:hypothetical protein